MEIDGRKRRAARVHVCVFVCFYFFVRSQDNDQTQGTAAHADVNFGSVCEQRGASIVFITIIVD